MLKLLRLDHCLLPFKKIASRCKWYPLSPNSDSMKSTSPYINACYYLQILAGFNGDVTSWQLKFLHMFTIGVHKATCGMLF